jgi:hypothetical protein
VSGRLPPELERVAERAAELALVKLAGQRHRLRARHEDLFRLVEEILLANPDATTNDVYRRVRLAAPARRQTILDLIRTLRADRYHGEPPLRGAEQEPWT